MAEYLDLADFLLVAEAVLGVPAETIARWPGVGLAESALLYVVSQLPDADKEGLTEAKAIKLMLAQPSMIKRPVLELPGGKLLVGFKPEQYQAAVAK